MTASRERVASGCFWTGVDSLAPANKAAHSASLGRGLSQHSSCSRCTCNNRSPTGTYRPLQPHEPPQARSRCPLSALTSKEPSTRDRTPSNRSKSQVSEQTLTGQSSLLDSALLEVGLRGLFPTLGNGRFLKCYSWQEFTVSPFPRFTGEPLLRHGALRQAAIVSGPIPKSCRQLECHHSSCAWTALANQKHEERCRCTCGYAWESRGRSWWHLQLLFPCSSSSSRLPAGGTLILRATVSSSPSSSLQPTACRNSRNSGEKKLYPYMLLLWNLHLIIRHAFSQA